MDMKGKNVVLGVTGGIAAYRTADRRRLAAALKFIEGYAG